METEGKVALITGGASGIGEAVAKDCAGAGLRVVVADMDRQNVDRVVQEIKAAGGESLGVQCNVADESQVKEMVEKTVETFGELNVVVPSAGIIRDSLMVNTDRETGRVKKVMSLEDFTRVIEVNLTGTFLVLREAAAAMIDGGFRGVLFTISSINRVGVAGQLNYSSTKAAVAIMPQVICNEFHRRKVMGIRCVGIAPGYVGTPILKGMNPAALEKILQEIPIGRLIEPSEISDLVLFCIRNEAMHGVTIDICGGLRPGN